MLTCRGYRRRRLPPDGAERTGAAGRGDGADGRVLMTGWGRVVGADDWGRTGRADDWGRTGRADGRAAAGRLTDCGLDGRTTDGWTVGFGARWTMPADGADDLDGRGFGWADGGLTEGWPGRTPPGAMPGRVVVGGRTGGRAS